MIEPHHNTTITTSTSASNVSTIDGVIAPVRPQVAVEFGSKVPKVVRQRYLDKIIDEYTPKLQSLQEVYDKVTTIHFACQASAILILSIASTLMLIRWVEKFPCHYQLLLSTQYSCNLITIQWQFFQKNWGEWAMGE